MEVYLPDQQTIKSECKKIQATWSEADRDKRRVVKEPGSIDVTRVHSIPRRKGVIDLVSSILEKETL